MAGDTYPMAPQEFDKWLAILREHFPDNWMLTQLAPNCIQESHDVDYTGSSQISAAASSSFTVLMDYFRLMS